METKTCKYCGKDRPITNFEKCGTRKDGTHFFRLKCNPCRWPQKRNRRHRIRAAFIEYKKEQECYKFVFDDHRALEFHHPNDDKEHNVADMARCGYSLDKVMKEIKKCKVVCSNCHRILHYRA